MKPILANTLWFASCLPEALRFRQATHCVRATQKKVLLRITGADSIAKYREIYPLTDMQSEPAEPVLRRLPTSGTAASSKWIPYTVSLYREFQNGIAPWIVDLFIHYPKIMTGRSYWAISPVAAAGTSFGDDTEYLGWARRWVSSTLAVPLTVRRHRDISRWRRATLKHLKACRDLTFISIWHPSFLTLLLEEIENPAELWPNLRLISCWADAAAEQSAKNLSRMFPQAALQPKGLIATEGFVSLPLWNRTGAALAIRSHFFEFLDESGDVRLAHELVTGQEYSVVLTTGGGLRRYRLHDLVRVTGFENECPLLRFIGRENHVSDRFGEKVSEDQIRSALRGLRSDFAMVACEDRAYTLFIQADQACDRELLEYGERLEKALIKNIHYRYCRSLGQLEAVRIFRITRRGLHAYLAACKERGQQLGNAKPVWLHCSGGWERVFAGRVIQQLQEGEIPA